MASRPKMVRRACWLPWAAGSAATASTSSRASRCFVYNMLDLKRFRWEGQEALTPGKHTIAFDFQYDGPGFGKGGTGILRVDDNEVAKQTIPHTIPFIVTMDETFDVGIDTRTGRGRSGLQAAVPLQREAEQGDLQPRAGGPDRAGPQGHASKHHQSERLGREPIKPKSPPGDQP